MNYLKFAWFTFGLIILVTVNSCEYQTDKIYFKEVSKDVPPPDLTVNLNLNSDTVYIYGYSTIKLSLKLTNKTLYAVKFFLDGTEYHYIKYDGDVNNYSFNIDLSGKPVTKVTVEIYTSTGTGSIADKYNAEAFVYKSKEWILIYEPEKPVINYAVVDGRLKMSWTPVKSSAKVKYYISSPDSKDSTYNNWYIDSTYVGGHKYISVSCADDGVSGFGIYSEVDYVYPKFFIDNRSVFTVRWEKCKFYNNVKGYKIRINNFETELKPQDTAFIYRNGILGGYTSVEVRLLLKGYSQDNYKFIYIASLSGYYPGSLLPAYSTYSGPMFPYSGKTFYYWGMDNGARNLFQYSLDTKSITGRIGITSSYYLSVSPNNKYILYDESESMKLISGDGLSNLNSFPVKSITPNIVYYGSNISDVATSVYYDFSKNSLIVYDMLNTKAICQIPVSDYANQSKISANGKYIFEPKLNTLYAVDNAAYSKVYSDASKSYQFKYFGFSPDNPTRIALYDGTTFYLRNCSDFNTISSFSLNNSFVVNVDFDKKKILTYSNNTFYVYSLTDGNLLNTIPTVNYLTPGQMNVHLFNDYIFMDNVQLNLNDL